MVVDTSKQIGGLQIGRIIAKRETDGAFFSAIVAPYRELYEGEEVELLRVHYRHNLDQYTDFLVVGE